jgi:hypothetical protein
MICSSENLLRFIVRSLYRSGFYQALEEIQGVTSRRASDTSILPNFAFHRVGDSSTVKQADSDSVNPGSNPPAPSATPSWSVPDT